MTTIFIEDILLGFLLFFPRCPECTCFVTIGVLPASCYADKGCCFSSHNDNYRVSGWRHQFRCQYSLRCLPTLKDSRNHEIVTHFPWCCKAWYSATNKQRSLFLPKSSCMHIAGPSQYSLSLGCAMTVLFLKHSGSDSTQNCLTILKNKNKLYATCRSSF